MVKKLLDKRVAIISGGARGIGKAIASSLAAQGCNIVIIDPGYSIDGRRNNENNIALETANKLSTEYKVKTKGYSADVSEYDDIKNICDEVRHDMGKIDIVINNAAIIRDSFIFKLDHGDWGKVIRNNLSGAFNLISCTSKIIREQAKNDLTYSHGRIVNIISTSGIWGNYGQAAYASSKAGLIALTRVSALDLQRARITCNAVAPFAATRVTDSINPQTEEQKYYKSSAMKVKAHYVGELLSVLVSDNGQKITGQVIGVRGKEVFIFNNSNPVYTHIRKSDKIDDLANEIKNTFTNHLIPLKTDLEVFSSDPLI